MFRKISLAALAALLGLALSIAVAAAHTTDSSAPTTQTTSTNNGGGNPNCGNACGYPGSHNPTDTTKTCDPVPGNGCQLLPDTPCDRGHGGTELGNKHCGPDTLALSIVKAQSTSSLGPFTHDPINAALGASNMFYQITVTNPTGTVYDLSAVDSDCPGPDASGLTGPTSVAANSTAVFTCNLDVLPGVGGIPSGATPGGQYTLTNSVTVTATPSGGGTQVVLTDTVTASVS